MKKYLFLALLIPSLSQAWTLAQIQQNLQVPGVGLKLSCVYNHPFPTPGRVSYPFTSNAQYQTTAGTNNAKYGFAATTNVTGPVTGVYTAYTTADATFFKNINIYYTDSNGVAKTAVIPGSSVGTVYAGTPTSSWRKTDNQSVVFDPSTGLANNLKITGYPFYYTDPGNPNNTFFYGADLKVTVTLANGNPANFWFTCS